MIEEAVSLVVAYVKTHGAADLARDSLDLLITYYIFYRIALVLRGTRATQVGIGLAVVFVLYVVAQQLRLDTVLTLLSAVLSSAILIGVVVFQNDIRRGLMRVGARAAIDTGQSLEAQVMDSVVEATTELARHRIGAIITFEQNANLDEFVGTHSGHVLDATVSADLLVSLFIPEATNRLHDGAVIIRDLRVAKAGVFFPMPEGRVIDESFGSRHRAALGITEETDAVVIVVSEERGSMSFCFNGNIIANLDGPKLRAALEGVFGKEHSSLRSRLYNALPFVKKQPVKPTVVIPTKPISPTIPSEDLAATRRITRSSEELPAAQQAAPDSVRPSSQATPEPLRKKKVTTKSSSGESSGEQPSASTRSHEQPLRGKRGSSPGTFDPRATLLASEGQIQLSTRLMPTAEELAAAAAESESPPEAT